MNDKEWEAWTRYSKKRWLFVQGDRGAIESFLEWREQQRKDLLRKTEERK